MEARKDDALTEDDVRVATDEEQAEIEAALGPRRTAQVPVENQGKTKDEVRLEQLQWMLAAREKRNPVPKSARSNIKVRRTKTRNIQRASRKANR
jgi:hypothetical protein